jgi:hypothetical protein
MSLHRQSARQLSRAAQITALAALALLAVVIMAPRKAIQAPVIELPPTQTPADTNKSQASSKSTQAPAQPQDWTALTAALDAARVPIAGAATTASVNPTGATTTATNTGDPNSDDNPDEPRPQPAPPGWQYLGYAKVGDDRLSALVTINNIQRFVRAGMQFDSYLISDITTSHVLLKRDDQRFEVVRSKPAPFSTNASRGATPAVPGAASSQGQNVTLEEQRLQLEAERNRRLREASQNAANAGQGGTQNL